MIALFDTWKAQISAELFSQLSTDFHDWSRLPGYTHKTEFLADGNIIETLVNTANGSVLATLTTTFPADDIIRENLVYTVPALNITKVMTFNGNIVNEVIT